MLKRSQLEKLSLAELQELVDAKREEQRKRLPALLARRDRLQGELDELTEEIALLDGGSAAAPKAKRPRKKGAKPGRPRKAASKAKPAAKKTAKKTAKKRGRKRETLPQALHRILTASDKPMSPNELCNIISRSNHASAKSSSLRLQVTNALSNRPEFDRVSRGQYVALKPKD